MKQTPIISMKKICKSFPLEVGGQQQVLFDISFTINPGEFVAIMGPSGSGKSTCMNIIGALDSATSGIYELYGKDITTLLPDELAKIRNEYIGFVFQNFNLLPKRNILDNVMLPLMYRGLPMEERLERAREMLQLVNLENFETYLPTQLSGGMKQRVAIAKALALKPEIILMDEPFAALDAMTRRDLQNELLRIAQEEACTIIFVTHNIQEALILGKRILVLTKGGRIVYDQKNIIKRPVSPASEGYGEMWQQLNNALSER